MLNTIRKAQKSVNKLLIAYKDVINVGRTRCRDNIDKIRSSRPLVLVGGKDRKPDLNITSIK